MSCAQGCARGQAPSMPAAVPAGRYGALGILGVPPLTERLPSTPAGIASIVVSFFLSMYYNVINAWAFWYLFHSFQVRGRLAARLGPTVATEGHGGFALVLGVACHHHQLGGCKTSRKSPMAFLGVKMRGYCPPLGALGHQPCDALLAGALVATVPCTLGWVCLKAGGRVGPGQKIGEGHPQGKGSERLCPQGESESGRPQGREAEQICLWRGGEKGPSPGERVIHSQRRGSESGSPQGEDHPQRRGSEEILPSGEGHPQPQAAQHGDKQAPGRKLSLPSSPGALPATLTAGSLPTSLPPRTRCRGPPAP